IAGIPAAATHVQLGAVGSHWPRDLFRRVLADGTTIHWPIGDRIDVVTQEKTDVWLFRGAVQPASLAELMRLAQAPDAIKHIADRIGWTNETGYDGALATGFHAVFHDIAPGAVTACIAKGPKVSCRTATADGHNAAVRDGRHWPTGTGVFF
ncbi:MAG: hypothetical protein JO257_18740, partial [Deltaproteobacteria bacterium]|nr:hypothetical protein [Deltaproteobacteria bacterium]